MCNAHRAHSEYNERKKKKNASRKFNIFFKTGQVKV